MSKRRFFPRMVQWNHAVTILQRQSILSKWNVTCTVVLFNAALWSQIALFIKRMLQREISDIQWRYCNIVCSKLINVASLSIGLGFRNIKYFFLSRGYKQHSPVAPNRTTFISNSQAWRYNLTRNGMRFTYELLSLRSSMSSTRLLPWQQQPP